MVKSSFIFQPWMAETSHVVLSGVRLQRLPSEFWDHITAGQPWFHHQIISAFDSWDFEKVMVIKAHNGAPDLSPTCTFEPFIRFHIWARVEFVFMPVFWLYYDSLWHVCMLVAWIELDILRGCLMVRLTTRSMFTLGKNCIFEQEKYLWKYSRNTPCKISEIQVTETG